MVCAACTADVPDEDVFCENCGARLQAVEHALVGEACACGAAVAEADEDGFCPCCGRRVRRPASDHIEQVLSRSVAAVSDRGLRHDRNEDRFALVEGSEGLGAVVCDGVSATEHAEVASAAVAAAVAEALQAVLDAHLDIDTEEAMRSAIAVGAEALRTHNRVDGGAETAPSTTVVAALVAGREIVVGWVGDSRAYWVDADGVRALTRDHSWRNMVLESGTMTEAEADQAPQAHAITRWLGADAGAESTPEIVLFEASSAGTLLLCTDGLWNYATHPEEIAALLAEAEGEEALGAARRLVGFANAQGGRDNVTVAVVRLPGPAGSSLSETGLNSLPE